MTPESTSNHYRCDDCNGTGADPAKTAAARKRGVCDSHSYIRCWTCNGNGLDPAKFFTPTAARAPDQPPGWQLASPGVAGKGAVSACSR